MGSKWVLVTYHTSEGQSAKIAERIARALRRRGAVVDVFDADDAPTPTTYDGVVLGDSIHATHHSRQLRHYIAEHVDALNAMHTALFQVSLASANPDAEHTEAAEQLVQELLDKTGLRPKLTVKFAGALVNSKYGWLKRRIVRAIVRKEAGGDVDLHRDYEYTDWGAVDRFAADVFDLIPDGASRKQRGTT